MDPTKIMSVAETAVESAANDSLISLITVFVLAIFVGYYVVWNVTAAAVTFQTT